jgi:hypothetical protein
MWAGGECISQQSSPLTRGMLCWENLAAFYGCAHTLHKIVLVLFG